MLRLARKLAECDQDYFSGWVMAGLDIKIEGCASDHQLEIAALKAKQAIIEVKGLDRDGGTVQVMRVILVKPDKLSSKKVQAAFLHGTSFAEHKFTVNEIQEYLSYTGDQNRIHRCPLPVVPGIMMIDWIFKHLKLNRVKCRVKFLQPVFSGEQVCFYKEQHRVGAYVQDKTVLSINFN